MVKVSTEHHIYEVWNENVADSVFFQSSSGKRPTKKDLIDICIEEGWFHATEIETFIGYIQNNIHVFKLKRFYTNK